MKIYTVYRFTVMAAHFWSPGGQKWAFGSADSRVPTSTRGTWSQGPSLASRLSSRALVSGFLFEFAGYFVLKKQVKRRSKCVSTAGKPSTFELLLKQSRFLRLFYEVLTRQVWDWLASPPLLLMLSSLHFILGISGDWGWNLRFPPSIFFTLSSMTVPMASEDWVLYCITWKSKSHVTESKTHLPNVLCGWRFIVSCRPCWGPAVLWERNQMEDGQLQQ